MGRSSTSTLTTRGKSPAWLEGLTGETTFFGGCGTHQNRKKNEKNIFCLSCCLSLCPHCLPSHPHHPLLQVRRYVYHDVIRLDDLQKLIDCAYIQPYTINGAKVIFLKERAQQSRTSNSSNKGGSPNICTSCDRFLQQPFHFCSLSCKVNHMTYQGNDLSFILRRFDESHFTISELDGLRMDTSEMHEDHTDNMIFDEALQYNASRPCSSNVDDGTRDSHHNDIACTKKKSNDFLHGIGLSFGNRRKGAPQRSPFC